LTYHLIILMRANRKLIIDKDIKAIKKFISVKFKNWKTYFYEIKNFNKL